MPNIYETGFEYALRAFDFYKVQRAMTFLNWNWSTRDGTKIPDVGEMKALCRNLMDCVMEEMEIAPDGQEYFSAMSGGFEVAVNMDARVRISFILEESNPF